MPNKYDTVIDEMIAGEQSQLQVSVDNAVQFEPDARAKDVALADKYNVPVETAVNERATLQKKEKTDQFDYGKLIDETPEFAKFMSNPDNAAISQDDVENMGSFEAFMANQEQASRIGSNTKTIGQIDFIDLVNENLTTEQLLALERSEQPTIDFDLGFVAGIPGAVTETAPLMFSQIGDAAILAAPFAAAGAVTGPGALAVGGLAFDVGLFTEFANSEANFAFRELGKEKDVDGNPISKEAAVGGAIVTGAVNGALENLGFKTLGIGTIPKRIAQTFTKNAVKKALKNPRVAEALVGFGAAVVRGGAGEGATEGIQEFSSALINEATKAISEQDFVAFESEDPTQTFIEELIIKVWESTKKGAQAGIGLGGSAKTVNLGIDIAKVKKQERNAAIMQSLGENAQNSKTLERAPERMKQWVKSVKDKYGTITDIYIPADKFTEYFQSQGVPPIEVARQLGVDDQYLEAISVGGDLIVPLEEYYTNIAATEHHEAMMQDMRFSPEEFSAADTASFEEERQRLVDEEIVKIDAENAVVTSENEVFNDVYLRLKDANESDQDARTQAALYGAFFNTAAIRSDKDPFSLYLGRNLTIARESEFLERTKITMDDVFLERAKNIALGEAQAPRRAAAKTKKRPLLNEIKKRGGISLDSPVAVELASIGIDSKSAPGLFKKTGGLKDIDNLVRSEVENATGLTLPDDGTGNVDRNELLNLLRDEQFDDSVEVDEGDLGAQVDDFVRYIDSLGMNFEDNTLEEIRTAVNEAQDPNIRRQLNERGSVGVNTFVSPDVEFARFDPLTGFREIGEGVTSEEQITSALEQEVREEAAWRDEEVSVEDTETGEQFTVKAGDVIDGVKKNINSITKLVDCLK